ncbi:lipopolysaccharide biosynthesis protein [Leuconostoc mesenteroides]|uniref:lipopolysaccharide biosynthesis protein n=1 Tax=Leuconostoc mesenteroides TaxID=1245 RepID=UPI00385C91CB
MKKSVSKNVMWAFSSQMVVLISQFLVQMFFVRELSVAYVGANGLFTNVISILSFAELGIGSALNFALYEPILEKNTKKIQALMKLYRNAYVLIGLVILVFGAVMVPFIPSLIAEKDSIPNVGGLFYLAVLGTAVSYFFNYSRAYLIANQESWEDSKNRTIYKVVQTVAQILILILWKRFDLFLIVPIITTVLSNLRIAHVAIKKAPFLKIKNVQSNVLTKSDFRSIKGNIAGSFSSRIGYVLVNGTDNILISKFIGLSVAGMYSSYLMIFQGINSILGQVHSSLIATIGSKAIQQNDQEKMELLKAYLFINAVIVAAFSPAMIVFIQSFIRLWVGTKLELPILIPILLTINFALTQLRQPVLSMLSGMGLFWEMRYKSFAEAGVNLVVSLFLLTQTSLGVSAVILGTIASNFLIDTIWEPVILFGKGIEHTPLPYIKNYLGYSVYLYSVIFISGLIVSEIGLTDILPAMFLAIGSAIFSVLLLVMLSWRTESFKTVFRWMMRKEKS